MKYKLIINGKNVIFDHKGEEKMEEIRPEHYCSDRKFEPKDVIRDWGLNFNLGNVVKYVARNGKKDGNSSLQDLIKARTYLDFEINALTEEE